MMGNKKLISKAISLLAFIVFGCFRLAFGQYEYRNAPLSKVINNIEETTSFQFLYRDALISDIRLNFSAAEGQLWKNFRQALSARNLSVKIDSTRKQVLIFQHSPTETATNKISIRGQVVDATTGERLPFATITWQQDQTVKGLSTNESGVFQLYRTFRQDTIRIQCSYIGYAPKTVRLDLATAGNMKELTFRLKPVRINGNQIVVTGTDYYHNINKGNADLIDIGTFSPMGETNTLRALQALPSVSLAPAMSDGLHVRGSPTDGFQVLVDNITIYNQSHLFGLVDSFNADVLQRSGFFYDIAPAQYQAPPGGTLSLYTKTGSLHKLSATIGITNSSARLTLEGPIKQGSSSWLISGRRSYMDTINWFNNSEMVKWGLDVDRQREVLDDGLIDFQSKLITPGKTDASFFDLHAKAYFEGNHGNRFILSGYYGGDNTYQQADRLFRSFSSSNQNRIAPKSVATTNEWENSAGSLQYLQWIGDKLFSNTTAGLSIYQTSFSKDDFTYIDFNQTTGSLQAFIFPFENKSILNEIKIEQRLEYDQTPWLWTGGMAYYYYMGEYFEDSFDRPGFFSSQHSHKIDAYLQLDFSGLDFLDIFAGNRVYYYSSGQYLKWSPRVKLTLFPDSPISISAGYSRNHQFLNQISLSNTVTSDVWILAGPKQPPTSDSYYSAGISFSLSKHLYTQVEGYYKKFENIRLHEINAYSLSNTFNSNPWYINNKGIAKGLEVTLSSDIKFLTLTQTLAISKMALSNPLINNSSPFYADWDRTYRYGASLAVKPFSGFSLYLSWLYATGTPNKLAVFGKQNEERLGDYQRADISVKYNRHLKKSDLSLSMTLFNVLSRQNPWYRELTFVIDKNTSPNSFNTVPVDIYDIGFQPSFNIRFSF
ncbi:MAG: TonB-dependent receptor [Balneolaceae bacterium]|jgi:hypothetical protein